MSGHDVVAESPGAWTMVTVAYNSADHLTAWWRDMDLLETRWIVVDNASTDDSRAVAERLGAHVISLPENLGFSAANNVGLRAATSDYVLFVNPDVAVDVSSLALLAHTCESLNALVAPQLIGSDGSVQPNGRGLPFLVDKFAHRGVPLPFGRVADYIPPATSLPTYVAWVMGAALGGRRTDFEELGGWNEDYFLYYEDHDIGLRAWRSGLAVVVDPQCTWKHAWQRETTRARLGPWRRELASAATFYRHYPELILPTRQLAARRHFDARRLSGVHASTGPS